LHRSLLIHHHAHPLGFPELYLHLVPLPAQRSLVTTFFLLALFIYGEDIHTIAELSIDDYLYLDVKVHNVSGLPPLMLPPPTCDLSCG
jgi:hypothetical protein